MSLLIHFFFFKQKTAYEMRISDWSSDVCSSDLPSLATAQETPRAPRWCSGLGRPSRGADAAAFTRDPPGAMVAPRESRNLRGHRSEERRVGKEWFSTCRSRWSP